MSTRIAGLLAKPLSPCAGQKIHIKGLAGHAGHAGQLIPTMPATLATLATLTTLFNIVDEPAQADHASFLYINIPWDGRPPLLDRSVSGPRSGGLPKCEQKLAGATPSCPSDFPDQKFVSGLDIMPQRLAMLAKLHAVVPRENAVDLSVARALVRIKLEGFGVEPTADLQLLAELTKFVNLLLANLANRSKKTNFGIDRCPTPGKGW